MTRTVPLAFTFLVILGAARPAAAGDEVAVYAMTEKGRVSVNSTLFEVLPGKFDLDNLKNPNGTQRWTDIVVSGSDRYELRLDGLVVKNGEPFLQLPFFVSNFIWSRLRFLDGELYALRTDGVLSLEDGELFMFEGDSFDFYDVAVLNGVAYVLRGDGALFVEGQADPVVDFNGKKNKLDSKEGKGSFGASVWQRLVRDPVDNVLVALRGDGQLQQWAPGDLEPMVLDPLPFPKKSEKVRSGHRYVDLEIAEDGKRFVLRRDGKVYDLDQSDAELVDYPGRTKTGRKGEGFVDLALLDGAFMAVRWDGKFYQGLSTDLVVDLERKRYVRLATSNAAPDKMSFANSAPVAAVYSAKAVEGTPLSIPLIATDVDRAEDQLVVVPDLSKLPAGVSYDPDTRTVHWPDPGPTGKYSFQVAVDDGYGSGPSVFKYTIAVKAAATGDKNHKPLVSRISPVQALVGRPFVLPILVADRNGDELAVTPVVGKGAFAAGATYDDVLGAFVWTPAFADVGKTSAKLEVSDGAKKSSLSFKIQVMNPLIFGDG